MKKLPLILSLCMVTTVSCGGVLKKSLRDLGVSSATDSSADARGPLPGDIGAPVSPCAPPMFETHVLPIFSVKCASCHGTASANPLHSEALWQAHIGTECQDAASPTCVIHRIMSGASNTEKSMPPTEGLPAGDQKLILDWFNYTFLKTKPEAMVTCETSAQGSTTSQSAVPKLDSLEAQKLEDTFMAQISPIYERACSSCHSAPGFISYGTMDAWLRNISRTCVGEPKHNCLEKRLHGNNISQNFSMPPLAETTNRAEMSMEDRALAVEWIARAKTVLAAAAANPAPTPSGMTPPGSNDNYPIGNLAKPITGPAPIIMSSRALEAITTAFFKRPMVIPRISLVPTGYYDLNAVGPVKNGNWLAKPTMDYTRILRNFVAGPCEIAVNEDSIKLRASQRDVIVMRHLGRPTAVDISAVMTDVFRANPIQGQLHPGATKYYEAVANLYVMSPMYQSNLVWTALCQAIWTDPRAFMR